MQKQQIFLISSSLVLVLGLYFLGPTVTPEKKAQKPEAVASATEFTIEGYKGFVFKQTGPFRQSYLENLEKALEANKNTGKAHAILHQLAEFFRDSLSDPTLQYFYEGRIAELDNTEKSLTFAAHSILGYLPYERNHDQLHWLAGRGKELFEKALLINPANDSSIVGLGGCLMYGASDGNSMGGILKVREVADKDSNNMFAQYMLGIGGVISQQYDRAAARFERVVQAQPGNMEVMFKLAEAYEMAGQKRLAADWYENIMKRVDNPDLRMEIQKRIDILRKD